MEYTEVYKDSRCTSNPKIFETSGRLYQGTARDFTDLEDLTPIDLTVEWE